MQVAQQKRSPLLEVRRSQPTIQETFQSGAVELQLVLHIIGVVGWRAEIITPEKPFAVRRSIVRAKLIKITI